MAVTPIISTISVDLQRPSVDQVIYAKQHDRLARKIQVNILNNGGPYTIPTSGVKYVVRVFKPDGTICIYEKDENDDDAVNISGNTVTITIAQQALACPGNVKMELVICNTTEEEILTSFSFNIMVEASAINGPASTNYTNPIIPTEFVKTIFVDQQTDKMVASIIKNNDETLNLNIPTAYIKRINTVETSSIVQVFFVTSYSADPVILTIPSAYIKQATVSVDGNTLYLTNADGTSIPFHPQSGGGSGGGDIVYLEYDISTLEEGLEAFENGKTLFVKFEIRAIPRSTYYIFAFARYDGFRMFFYPLDHNPDSSCPTGLYLSESGWLAGYD